MRQRQNPTARVESSGRDPMILPTMPTSIGTLTFSRRPTDEIYGALGADEVDIWWNLARELRDQTPRMREHAAEVLEAGIADFGVPTDLPAFAEQLDRVVTILRCSGHVHVSCYGGRGRTGLALACIRMLLEEEAAEVALRRAHEVSGGPETAAQAAFVVDLQRALGGG